MIDPIERVVTTPVGSIYDTDLTLGVMDLLSWHECRNSRMQFERLRPSFRIIADSLEHITVNPKNKFKTFMLSGAYVYSRPDSDNVNKEIVNANRDSAKEFAKSLVAVADSEWLLAQKRSAVPVARVGRVTILTGEKGSGKTYFLNHLFSACSTYFDEQKTVWVRVNLSRDKNFGEDLTHWYQAQAAKILLRYYERTSTGNDERIQPQIDILGPLNDWASKLPDRHRVKTDERISRLISMFCEKGPDSPLTPAIFPPDISEKIFSIALASGLRFIIVFDGYDSLDCDRLSRSRFRSMSKQLRTLVSNPSRAGIAIVVVCRTETLAQVANAWSLSTDRGISAVRLEPSPFYDVVVNRIDRLVEWIDSMEHLNEKPESDYEARTICLDFKSHFITRFDDGYFDEMVSLFPTNNRACVQMLHAEFADFIANKRSLGGYRLIEMLTLAGFSYPPVIYEYFRGGDDQLVCDYNSDEGVIPYDTRFLPIITRPPVPRKGRNVRPGRQFGHGSVLHGLRILQFVKVMQRTARYGADGVALSAVKYVLNRLFGFHPSVTAMFCYELEAYGCVRINREYPERNASDDDSVMLMPKGNQIISATFWDPAYLNLSAVRTILPRSVLSADLFRLPQPFFSNMNVDRHIMLARWGADKICNALGLLRIMHDVNTKQLVQTLDVIDVLYSEDLADIDLARADILEIFDETREHIAQSVDQVIHIYRALTAERDGLDFDPVHAGKERGELRKLILDWVQD
ncbi:MAG TPA: hypothetical protein VF688_15355 [Allosphingosinicella sp.]